ELKYAEGFLNRALDLGKQLSDAQSMAIILNSLGVAHRRQGKLNRAAACYKHSLALAEELNDREYVARALYNLGLVYWQQGKLKDAKAYYQRCFPLFEEFGLLEEGVTKTLEDLFSRDQMDQQEQEDLESVIKGLSKLAEQLEK
ncbi:MAG: tetratricopeptide repeat protein, partial [Candidatus Hodarchaeota archaeon]